MLTQTEKLDIVYSVLIKFKQVKDIAKEFRVSTATVTMLVSKARKRPHFIDELYDKRDQKELRYQEIESCV